jgi:hypothetical protein
MGNRNTSIFIFTFVVLMVLLRPYAAYQISSRADMASNPVKVNNLLQRLVKKRDEHHTAALGDFSAVQPSKSTFVLPVVLTLFYGNVLLLAFTVFKRYRLVDTVFYAFPFQNYLKLLSKFQI